MKEYEYGIIKRLKRSYIIALSAIAILATASCTILLQEIHHQESSSRVINISGRQRMLSQNIVKNILLLNNTNKDSKIYTTSKQELEKSYNSWIKAHNAFLYGDTDLKIPKLNLSATNTAYFKAIQSYHTGIAGLAKEMLSNDDKRLSGLEIERLLGDEQQFLSLMDNITFQFDEEANREVLVLRRYEIVFWIITLLTLLVEASLIFKPMVKIVHRAIVDYDLLLEQKKRQQQEHLKAIMIAQETERKRIAVDIHDGIGQMISLAKVNLSSLQEKHPECTSPIIHNALTVLDDIANEVRSISFSLMPSSLRELGLIAALEELAAGFRDNTRIQFHFLKDVSNQTFGEKVDINLFRVIQELVNNTIKHANASEIHVQLIQHESSLVLTYEDNGTGFNENTAQYSDGIGMKNIRSRINALNGEEQINSAPGYGISVTIEIPINIEKDEARN